MLDPASWFRSFFHAHQKVVWEEGEEPKFLGFVPYDNTLFFLVVVLPACAFNLMLLWSCFSHSREPSWVRNATSISKFWSEITSGSTVAAVKTGHLCRKYMGHFNPGNVFASLFGRNVYLNSRHTLKQVSYDLRMDRSWEDIFEIFCW